MKPTTSNPAARHTERPEFTPVLPARHPGRTVAGWLLIGLLAVVVGVALTNPRFEWDVVVEYFTTERILAGVWLTLWLTGVCMLLAIVIGTIVAVGRLSANPVVSRISWLYVWAFRGVPVLVQLVLWFNLSALFPSILIEIPGIGVIADWETNDLITPLIAAILGLALHESAYMAEIIRGGIQAVDEGQTEAAMSLGMRRFAILQKVVLPQAVPIIIPPTGNQLIGLLKYSSLVSVLAVPELLYSAQLIYQVNFKVIPLLIVATIWYLIITSVLSIGQFYMERYFARGRARALPPTPIQQFRSDLAEWWGRLNMRRKARAK